MVAMALTSRGIEFLDFIQAIIAEFYMVVPSESECTEFLCQVIKLHPLHEILWADLVFGGDSAHPVDHSSVIALHM